MWETHSESAHGHCLVGFVFKCTTHGIRCSSAGGYQTALHCCGRPLLDWGWIACIRCKVSCTEPRGPYCDGSVQIHVSCHPYYSAVYFWIIKMNWIRSCLFGNQTTLIAPNIWPTKKNWIIRVICWRIGLCCKKNQLMQAICSGIELCWLFCMLLNHC